MESTKQEEVKLTGWRQWVDLNIPLITFEFQIVPFYWHVKPELERSTKNQYIGPRFRFQWLFFALEVW